MEAGNETAALDEAQPHQAAAEAVGVAMATETSFSNQETDKAAITMKCVNGNADITKTTTTATTTNTLRLEDVVAFVMPATTEAARSATPRSTTKSSHATKSAGSSRSSSLRKQRRAAGLNNMLLLDVAGGGGVALGGGGSGCDIKISQSMTSLPADELQQERRDTIQAKLHLERPYNSLKVRWCQFLVVQVPAEGGAVTFL